jgi:hypothetical protein
MSPAHIMRWSASSENWHRIHPYRMGKSDQYVREGWARRHRMRDRHSQRQRPRKHAGSAVIILPIKNGKAVPYPFA